MNYLPCYFVKYALYQVDLFWGNRVYTENEGIKFLQTVDSNVPHYTVSQDHNMDLHCYKNLRFY